MKSKYLVLGAVVALTLCVFSIGAIYANNSFQLISTSEAKPEVELVKTQPVDQGINNSKKNQPIDQDINNLINSLKRGEKYSVNTAIKRVYSEKDFRFLRINPVGEIYQSNIAPRTLASVYEQYPFEFVEKISDTLLYVAYKMRDNGYDYYKYLFFNCVNSNDRDKYGSWVLDGRTFTISQISEYADFRNIKTGSSLSDVAAIEPLAMHRKPLDYIEPYKHESFDAAQNKYVEVIIPPPALIEYDDYYYLKDGILKISFSKPNNRDSEFLVTGILFNKDFVIDEAGRSSEDKKISAGANNSAASSSSARGMRLKISDKDFPASTE